MSVRLGQKIRIWRVPAAFTAAFWLAGWFAAFRILSPSEAWALRPFDGTDADVAEYGTFELELQTFGGTQAGSEKTLIAPAPVFNYGFAPGWEAVLQGQLETPLASSGAPDLAANGAYLKHVLLPGSLQGFSGPSLATEFGVLLPGVHAGAGTGASWAGIISQRWDWGTIHVNGMVSLLRDQTADLFFDTIVEGPASWPVRPVAEVYYETAMNQSDTVSGLIGLIWQARENLAFDLAFRHAITGGRRKRNQGRIDLGYCYDLAQDVDT